MSMDQVKQKPSKRLDLQGIRALAIIVVLGFHFFPELFPNGYLGVDQFFVLSGFLMCMLLKRAENKSSFSLVRLFYSKRFQRILPLYLLVIFISMICLYNFFPDTAIETNQESAIHALLFVSNRPKTLQEDYFQMLSIAVDIFTHTWSLSVEIQFYFLVPFIYLFATKVPKKFQFFYYGAIGFFSFVFFYSSSATVSFNSVFARIWQFLIGMVVYLIGISKPNNAYQIWNNGESKRKQLIYYVEKQGLEFRPNRKLGYFLKFSKPIANISLIFLVFVTALPWTLPSIFMRPLVTIGTGLLMLVSEENLVLSNKVLTYIGDISYSLYLIHWPIYAYWKLTCDGNKFLLICALIFSIILAIATFEKFEKWYLKLSSKSIGFFVVWLFFCNIILINKDQINPIGPNFSSLDNINDDMTVDDAIRLNNKWSVNDNKNLYAPTCVYESVDAPYGWCRHMGLSKHGKYKIAIIGNSLTANHARMFYEECRHKAKSILQGAAYACEPLYPNKEANVCKTNLAAFEEHIRKEKPDYAFIVTRYIWMGAPFPEGVKSFNEDPIYQMMKEQMLKLISNIKYKLYILDALPRISEESLREIAQLVKSGTDPVEIDNMLIRPEEYEMVRKRHAQLMKDCKGKCEMVDYVPEFYNKATGTFRYFDERGFSYWTTSTHLSPHGLEHIRHVWTDICSKL